MLLADRSKIRDLLLSILARDKLHIVGKADDGEPAPPANF
jgi:hypothetical protein